MTLLFKVIPVPVTAKVPDVMLAKLTAPPLLTVKLLVPVFKVALAVIVPELLRKVNGATQVTDDVG